MPRRFNKSEIDEWRQAGKSHTCAACCVNCKDCSGTCDCVKCHEGKAKSVLDALESKTADILSIPAQQNPDLIPTPSMELRTEPCIHCGAPLAPFVLEHKLNCPHCGKTQNPIHWDRAMSSRQAAPVFDQTFIPQVTPTIDLQKQDRQNWGDVYPCPNCGHAVRRDFQECPACGEHSVAPAVGVGPAGDQPQPIRWGKTAEISTPPEGAPMEQKETALPYNPAAYEGMVEDMHPAAQYTYQRAVQQGAPPQAAMAAAQEKQGEMMKRTQEGQNVEGVQIPVINSKVAVDIHDENTYEKCKDCGKPMNPVEAMVSDTHGICGECTRRKHKEVASGFVPYSTIQRIAHLL
jgi:predicted RNA-binding Zn-ribbon protein involved in translation (DUF1610 family)